MHIDSVPQPCPSCSRSTVLASYHWGRQWVHVGTWRPQCDGPSWSQGMSGRHEDIEGSRLMRHAHPVGAYS